MRSSRVHRIPAKPNHFPPFPSRFSPGESPRVLFSGRAIDAMALVPCCRPSARGRETKQRLRRRRQRRDAAWHHHFLADRAHQTRRARSLPSARWQQRAGESMFLGRPSCSRAMRAERGPSGATAASFVSRCLVRTTTTNDRKFSSCVPTLFFFARSRSKTNSRLSPALSPLPARSLQSTQQCRLLSRPAARPSRCDRSK